MSNFERRGKYELLHSHTDVVDAGGYRVQIETFITKGQPFPMVTSMAGEPGWPEEDPKPEDEDSIFMTVVTASMDEEGEPDMTLGRKVVQLDTLA